MSHICFLHVFLDTIHIFLLVARDVYTNYPTDKTAHTIAFHILVVGHRLEQVKTTENVSIALVWSCKAHTSGEHSTNWVRFHSLPHRNMFNKQINTDTVASVNAGRKNIHDPFIYQFNRKSAFI